MLTFVIKKNVIELLYDHLSRCFFIFFNENDNVP